VLKRAGRLDRHAWAPSEKRTGFVQPPAPHQHWHVDVSYINVGGTFYFLCSVLDGYTRYIVHWELRESMKEPETETVIQRALENFPDARPRIISDNGPRLVARDFKAFIRLAGLTHVRTSPYCPQSKDYASYCTSLVRWGAMLGNRRGSVSLMPWCFIGRLAPGGSYKHSCLSL
jgi:putative transposase